MSVAMQIPFATICLLLAFLYALHKYIAKNFDHWEKKNIFYIQPIPFLGNFLDIALFRTTMGEYLCNFYNQTKEPFLGIFIFGTPHLVVRSPELIKSILVRDFSNFDDRTVASGKHDPIMSSAMFINKNPEWKGIRTKMTPVYTTGKLKGMVPLVNEVGDTMEAYIEKNIPNMCLEAKELCAKYSTDVIAKCAFGINAHCFDTEGDSEFRKIGRMVFDFRLSTAIQQTSYFFLPKLVELLRLNFVDPRAITFMKEVFWKTIKRREKTGERRNDAIDTIIEIKKRGEFANDNKVISQAVQFFLAGFETTSSTMAFTLYEMCLHPHIQTKARNEVKKILEQYGSFTYEAIQDMKYLHMCVSETLRKYPVLPFLDRRCKSDYKIPGTDIVIDKGTPVYIPMFGLHYDEEYFPQPHKYNPERFSDAHINDIVPFTYLPFGEGPRNCIGARFGMIGTKLGLAHILSKFEVERSGDTPVPLVFEPRSFVLASKVGLPMKFRKHYTYAG